MNNEERILFRGQTCTKISEALTLCHYLSIYKVLLIVNICETKHCSAEGGEVGGSFCPSVHGMWTSHVMQEG